MKNVTVSSAEGCGLLKQCSQWGEWERDQLRFEFEQVEVERLDRRVVIVTDESCMGVKPDDKKNATKELPDGRCKCTLQPSLHIWSKLPSKDMFQALYGIMGPTKEEERHHFMSNHNEQLTAHSYGSYRELHVILQVIVVRIWMVSKEEVYEIYSQYQFSVTEERRRYRGCINMNGWVQHPTNTHLLQKEVKEGVSGRGPTASWGIMPAEEFGWRWSMPN